MPGRPRGESYLGVHLSLEASLSGLAVRLNKTLRCNDRAGDPRLDAQALREAGHQRGNTQRHDHQPGG